MSIRIFRFKSNLYHNSIYSFHKIDDNQIENKKHNSKKNATINILQISKSSNFVNERNFFLKKHVVKKAKNANKIVIKKKQKKISKKFDLQKRQQRKKKSLKKTIMSLSYNIDKLFSIV